MSARKGQKFSSSSKVDGVLYPKTVQHKRFCESLIKYNFDVIQAGKDAGYSRNSALDGTLHRLRKRYQSYVMRRREKYELAVAKEMVLDQKDILSEMMSIGFANAQDYIVVTEELIDGKTIKKRKLKPIDELSRAQAAALSCVTEHPDGSITYNIPDEKSKHPYLKDLGQHLGLFHSKLIQEHRHNHLHAAISFKDLDSTKLAEAEQLLIEAMGPAGRRALGIIDAELGDIAE